MLELRRWKFLDKIKLCSIGLLVMVFVELSAKKDTFMHPNTILGKLGVTHDLG